MKNNVNSEIKKLLDESREVLLRGDNENGICYDGIVDEHIFFKSENKPRVAFLLKETNATDKSGNIPIQKDDWNYIEWMNYNQLHKKIRKEKYETEFLYKTYYNVCMWTAEFYDICDGKSISYKDYTYNKEDSGALDISAIRHMLEKVAIVNLKKTWGGSSTSWNCLNNYLTDNTNGIYIVNTEIQHVLQKEIKLISPKIVLCGGRPVYDFAKKIFTNNLEPAEALNTNTDCFLFENILFVNFRHPSCRGSRKAQFEYAKIIFEEIVELISKKRI